jgi:hypothetical protein
MGCRRHGKALRVFIGMLYYFPCKIVVCDRGAMRLNPVRWAEFGILKADVKVNNYEK